MSTGLLKLGGFENRTTIQFLLLSLTAYASASSKVCFLFRPDLPDLPDVENCPNVFRVCSAKQKESYPINYKTAFESD